MHIKRRDILENWLMIIAVTTLVQSYSMVCFCKMRKDREIICDAGSNPFRTGKTKELWKYYYQLSRDFIE